MIRTDITAATHIAQKILAFRPSALRPFVIGLPTGSTPVGTYNHLIQLHKTKKLSFEHIYTFNMDEYVGLGKGQPESFYETMRELLFKHIDIPEQNINILNGKASSFVEECSRYERKIRSLGGIHLFVGGVGVYGHLAFNEPGEPGTSFDSRTRRVALSQVTIKANARFFSDNEAQVPRKALTVGLATIMEAKEIMLLAAGLQKAPVIKKIIEEQPSDLVPASIVKKHQKSLLVCDLDAASLVRKSIGHDSIDND